MKVIKYLILGFFFGSLSLHAQSSNMENMLEIAAAGLSDSSGLESAYFVLKGRNSFFFKNYKEALEYAGSALKLDKYNKEAELLAADAYAALGKDKRALKHYQRATALDGHDPALLYHLALSNWKLGNNVAAMENLDKAIELEPDNSDFYQLRGEVKMALGIFATAMQDFEKVLELNPGDEGAIIKIGICLREIGNYAESIEQLSQAVSANPDNADAFLERGKTYLRAFNKKKACADFQKAAELGSREAVKLLASKCSS